MQTVTSRDGTRIAFWRAAAGWHSCWSTERPQATRPPRGSSSRSSSGGSQSTPWTGAVAEAAGIPPGQQHVAMYTAPEVFVSEVVQFLSATKEP